MGQVAIPASEMGTILDEVDIKRSLLELNPDFHFDLGGCLNIDHPYQIIRQGVFFKGRHLCSMDRGLIPEFAIYSLRTTQVRVPSCDVRYSELSAPTTIWEFITDADGNEVETGVVSVRRQERDRIIRVGWRHTLYIVLGKKFPGVDEFTLGLKLGVDLTWKPTEPVEMVEQEIRNMHAPQIVLASA